MSNLTHTTPDTNAEVVDTQNQKNMETDSHIQLSDGYSVSRAFYNDVQRHIEAVLPSLKRDARYKAEGLYGKTLWEHLWEGDRRLVGRCIAHMVAHDLLPLTFIEGRHEYPKFYQLK